MIWCSDIYENEEFFQDEILPEVQEQRVIPYEVSKPYWHEFEPGEEILNGGQLEARIEAQAEGFFNKQ